MLLPITGYVKVALLAACESYVLYFAVTDTLFAVNILYVVFVYGLTCSFLSWYMLSHPCVQCVNNISAFTTAAVDNYL